MCDLSVPLRLGSNVITRDIFVAGVGSFLPPPIEVEWAISHGLYAEPEEPTGLISVTVSNTLSAPEMALAAAERAVENAALDPLEIDLLVYADSFRGGPEGWLPQSYIQKRLVGGSGFVAGIRQGCNGAIAALQLAAAYLQADSRHRSALVVSADNFNSPDTDRWNCAPNMIMADGAAAVVVTESGFARLAAVSSLTIPEHEEMYRGAASLLPAETKLDFGQRFIEFRETEAAQAFKMSYFAAAPDFLENLLSEAGIGVEDIKLVLTQHAARGYIEDFVLGAVDLPLSLSTWDIGRKIGHVGPSDYVISFREALSTGRIQVGDHVLAYGVGPGVNISGAVFEMTDQPY